MNMMSLTLSDSLKSFIDEQVAEHAFATDGDYVRELIQREHDRQRFRQLIIDGLESPPGPVADDAYFEGLRARIRQRAAE